MLFLSEYSHNLQGRKLCSGLQRFLLCFVVFCFWTTIVWINFFCVLRIVYLVFCSFLAQTNVLHIGNPHCCLYIMQPYPYRSCIWCFCSPPLTRLDKPELAHTQRLLLVLVFIQTCRPASSVLPVGYLALSLSTLSLSSQDRTQQVTRRFRRLSDDDVSWSVLVVTCANTESHGFLYGQQAFWNEGGSLMSTLWKLQQVLESVWVYCVCSCACGVPTPGKIISIETSALRATGRPGWEDLVRKCIYAFFQPQGKEPSHAKKLLHEGT